MIAAAETGGDTATDEASEEKGETEDGEKETDKSIQEMDKSTQEMEEEDEPSNESMNKSVLNASTISLSLDYGTPILVRGIIDDDAK